MTAPHPTLDNAMRVSRPIVCIQGLGFVGAAMAAAVASASEPDGSPSFTVVGVELPTAEGRARAAALSDGRFPFATVDQDLVLATRRGKERGNLCATIDPVVYETADVVVVDVHLDVDTAANTSDLAPFRSAVRVLGERMRPGSLIIVETTVPPGTCANVVAPELAAALRKRGLPEDSLLLAHSYERVMPGPDYLSSITHFWRVYAGNCPAAAAACRRFLEKVVDTEAYPLTELRSTTASETAKVLENTFRAVTIALMDEWGRFSERVGIDLYEIVRAIRMRPTHCNIREPGFGVGGYCLTKDPLFGLVAARQLFDDPSLEFPLSRLAVGVNDCMPLHVVDVLREMLGGLAGKKIVLLGVAYRSEVDDTRYSPSETFVRAVQADGGQVVCHDPFVRRWVELEIDVLEQLPSLEGVDAVVLAIGHKSYQLMDMLEWLGTRRPQILDGNNVLGAAQLQQLAAAGCRVFSVGRGEIS